MQPPTVSFTTALADPRGYERLDKLIAASYQDQLGAPSRSQLKQWIEAGRVRVNGSVVTKAGALVAHGAQVEISPPEPSPLHAVPFEFPLEILFEDDALVVLNKPPGISMHPGAGDRERTLVNALVAHWGGMPSGFADKHRPGIVHRLDKDTSGVVVVAKTPAALASLSTQFAHRTIERRYLALVLSTPRGKRTVGSAESGTVETRLGRHPRHRTMMAVVQEGGRLARTEWQVVERFGYGVLVQLRLGTGRTHQIRVHMEHIGSPVIGDQVYGDFSSLPAPLKRAADQCGRQALHAASLAFDHPVTGSRLSFSAPPPADVARLVEFFRSFKR